MTGAGTYQPAKVWHEANTLRIEPLDARQRAESIVDELLKRATDAERARVNLLTYDYDRPETHHAQAWPRMQDAVRRLEAVRSQLVSLLEAAFARQGTGVAPAMAGRFDSATELAGSSPAPALNLSLLAACRRFLDSEREQSDGIRSQAAAMARVAVADAEGR